MSETKEHPILFNSEMVRAVLSGKKTQTRRVIKLSDEVVIDSPSLKSILLMCSDGLHAKFRDDIHFMPAIWKKCPYGQVGDQLWVQEGYQIAGYDTDLNEVNGMYLLDRELFIDMPMTKNEFNKFQSRKFPFRKTPGRFMYKSLSRISLEITDIRIERVQEITEEDAQAEGIRAHPDNSNYYKDYDYSLRNFNRVLTAKESFYTLWDSINEKRGFGWDVNSYVWIVEFRKC